MKMLILLSFPLLLLPACSKDSESGPATGEATGQVAESAPPTNRIDIPKAVRDNLGMTFAKVEERRIADARMLSGRVERRRSAKRLFSAISAGTIELKVRENQHISEGDLLATLAPTHIGEDQHELLLLRQEVATHLAEIAAYDAESQVLRTEADSLTARRSSLQELKSAREAHVASLTESITLIAAQLEELESASKQGGGLRLEVLAAREKLADLRSELRSTQEEVAESELELVDNANEARLITARQAARVEARQSLLLKHTQAQEQLSLIRTNTAINWGLGESSSIDDLLTMRHIELRASHAGIVTNVHVSSGEQVDHDAALLEVTRDREVVVRASITSELLLSINSDVRAAIRPVGGKGDWNPVTIEVGTSVNEVTKLSDVLLMPEAFEVWMLEGMPVEVRLELKASREAFVIPRECLIRDGLNLIYFLRDPDNPDVVIRMDADIGAEDGVYVQLKSGVLPGYEVVRNGVYELKLSGQGAATKGGHFHADGTWHEGSHEGE